MQKRGKESTEKGTSKICPHTLLFIYLLLLRTDKITRRPKNGGVVRYKVLKQFI